MCRPKNTSHSPHQRRSQRMAQRRERVAGAIWMREATAPPSPSDSGQGLIHSRLGSEFFL